MLDDGAIADEQPVEQQLEVLEEQRTEIKEEYDNGAISENEWKSADSKLRFQVAQIKEANAKDQQREVGRSPDMFGD